ncbi:MAG: UDP-N-acetylglucosamine 2-epimerase, partial [Planctomycetota bacterium]
HHRDRGGHADHAGSYQGLAIVNKIASVNVAVVTGTRAEWGLLESVHDELIKKQAVRTDLVVTGAHLLPDVDTVSGITAPISAKVVMQEPGQYGRSADAKALGRGTEGLASCFEDFQSHIVVVLGDRIEAFAAASAASVGGQILVHIHGGDRAEGVADEAMRHAITKLAHIHCCATEQSAERVRRMGEKSGNVHITGSPAVAGLQTIEPISEAKWSELCEPQAVIIHHGAGLEEEIERQTANAIANSVRGRRTLWLRANNDPGSETIDEVRDRFLRENQHVARIDHLPRQEFVGTLKRLAASEGVLIGNSSAALIECAALGVSAVNIGPRQSGRERANNIVDLETDITSEKITHAIEQAAAIDRSKMNHPYGDGDAAHRISEVIANIDVSEKSLLRKRNIF